MGLRTFTTRYIGALLVVAALNTVAFFAAEWFIHRYTANPAAITAAARLRTLSRQVAMDVHNVLGHPDGQDFPARQANLRGAVQRFDQHYAALRHGDRALGLPRQLAPEVRNTLQSAEGAAVVLRTTATAVATLPREDLVGFTPRRPPMPAMFAAADTLGRAVDTAELQVEALVERHDQWHIHLNSLFLAINLAVLLLLGLLVFRPALGALQRNNVLLRRSNERLTREMAQRLQTQQALEASERLFRSVIASAQDAIFLVDDTRRIRFWSDAAEALYGPAPQRVAGPELLRLGIPEEALRGDGAPARLLQSYAIGRSGARVPVELSIARVDLQHRTQTLVIARDVSSRVNVERERLKLATAVEQSDDSVVITDRLGRIEYVNPAFERLTGYTREEAIGGNPRVLKSGRHDKLFYAALWTTISRGQTWKGRIVNCRKDGSLFEEDATISPVRDAGGEITSYIAVKRDVTEQGRIEAELLQSRKLNVIGTLAGGIAHDFNNILTPILGYAELGQQRTADDSRERRYFDRIRACTLRARDLIGQILAFSRKGETRTTDVLLEPLVKETAKLLRATLPANIETQVRTEDTIPPVRGDATQLHTVLMNLCINAGQAMPDGGTLTIRVAAQPGGAGGAAQNGRPPGRVRLTVTDTGIGMDTATQARIFEPFFTTKPAGAGTGLGLSTAQAIVQRHGGSIAVRSTPGAGSTFTIELPAAEPAASAESRPVPLPPTGDLASLVVLVVDSEPHVADFLVGVVESWGSRAVAAASCHEALEVLRANGNPFDLVVTERVMPAMTCDRMIEEIRTFCPDVPVLVLTGDAEVALPPEGCESGCGLLHKPFTSVELQTAAHRLLHATRVPQRHAHV